MNKIEKDYIDWWFNRNETREDQNITIEGLDFFVPKTVFSPDPDMTHSTMFVLQNFPDVKGKKVLDIGTGCGIFGIYAALKGAESVIATDIDKESIKTARINGEKHRVSNKITFFQDNLAGNTEERFDVIFANLPILDEAWEHLDITVENIFSELFTRFCDYLTDEGKMIVCFASFGEEEVFRNLIKKFRLIYEEKTDKKFGVSWFFFMIRKGIS